MYLLMIYEILGLFFNILTVDHKYSLFNTENLPQSFQMQLSNKLKTLSEFFTPF